MDVEFTGEVWYWRGPSPFHFVSVPNEHCDAIATTAGEVSYGWGMIPASVRIGDTKWTTSLWPKDGGYVVPLKTKIREREQIDLGDHVTVRLTIDD